MSRRPRPATRAAAALAVVLPSVIGLTACDLDRGERSTPEKLRQIANHQSARTSKLRGQRDVTCPPTKSNPLPPESLAFRSGHLRSLLPLTSETRIS